MAAVYADVLGNPRFVVLLDLLFAFVRIKYLVALIRALFLDGTFAGLPDKPKPGTIKKGNEPQVTIQICTYNEGPVVVETIRRSCAQDWPKDKLTVQILDDSTEESTIKLIEDAVADGKRKDVDVKRLTRVDRVGYKVSLIAEYR